MKRIFLSLLLAVTCFISACNEEKNTNRIYVFSQPGCGHCEHAKLYLDRYYKDYDIKELNIREGSNMDYLMRYARKFKVPTQSVGTPFIVMRDNYIMGWGTEQQKKFNVLAKDFSPQK